MRFSYSPTVFSIEAVATTIDFLGCGRNSTAGKLVLKNAIQNFIRSKLDGKIRQERLRLQWCSTYPSCQAHILLNRNALCRQVLLLCSFYRNRIKELNCKQKACSWLKQQVQRKVPKRFCLAGSFQTSTCRGCLPFASCLQKLVSTWKTIS